MSSAHGRRISLVMSVALAVLLSCHSRVPPVSSAGSSESARTDPPPSSPPRWGRPSPVTSHVSEGEYILPPPEVIRLLETESPPEAILHRKSGRLLQLYEQQLKGMEQASRPSLALASLRIDGANLTLRNQALYTRFDIRAISDPSSKMRKISPGARIVYPPEGALFGGAQFSPNGNRLVLSLVYSDHVGVGIYDWLRDELRTLETGPLSRVWNEPCTFLSEEELLCSRPLHSGAPPSLEVGPKIRELKAGAVPALAYSHLLRDAQDDALFEHYTSIQPVVLGLDGAELKRLPTSGVIPHYSLSPNRKYLLSTPLHRPYSRLLPARRLLREVVVHELSSSNKILSIEPPPGSSGTTSLAIGVRMPFWAPDKAATLTYLKRQRTKKGLLRDALLFHDAPFKERANIFAADLHRVESYGWTSQGSLYMTDAEGGSSWTSYLLKDGQRRVIKSGDTDRTGDPSRSLRLNGNRGPILEYKGKLFFAGRESAHHDFRPRLLSFKMEDASTETLWRSGRSEHAEIFAVLDPQRPQYLLRAETASRPPSFSVTGAGPRRRVTQPAKPYEQLKGVRRHLIRYRRADGLMLSAMLYLPPNFEARSKVPTVFWIYPRQYGSFRQATFGAEVSHQYFLVKGPSRFLLLTQGYALLDAPSMPIVGRIKSGSNDFLPQLKQNAEAAIDHLVKLGVSDRDRIAVMGRSYGAFGTANLMAHTQLFKTGIAISGAYNRTLTPFGFQKETRTFWQSTDSYVNMSPFFFADQMKGSLLLLHGELDDNPGTPVLQSERFYAALAGNGVQSRYISFPFEGHQFRGRRAVLHSAAEIIRWLDTHLKGKN